MSTAAIAPADCKELQTWKVLGHSSVAIPQTGSTIETTAVTLSIPGGTLGPNGVLRLWTLISATNNANNKNMRAKLAGSLFHAASLTTHQSAQSMIVLRNRNNQAVQLVQAQASYGFAAGVAAVQTFAIDTSLSQNLTITLQLANAGDTLTLESWLAEVFYGA